MKKFLFKCFIFAFYVFLVQVVFPYAVDPFNVFHALNIRENGIEPNQNYIKMKYILSNPDKFNGFMFGSSRVGVIHTEKIPCEKIYNMTYSMGTISEHLSNIKTFFNAKIYPTKIYIGLDSFSYTIDAQEHLTQPVRCPYGYLCDNPKYFYSLYLSPYNTLLSLLITNSGVFRLKSETFYKYGWWGDYDIKSEFDWNAKEILPSIGRKNFLKETLNDIQEIVKLCRENKIELIIFTNPMYDITYRASIEKNYFDFLEGLVKITDFYNFSSLNDITLNNENYIETSHYRAEVGDMIINVICNGKKIRKTL